MTYSEIREWQIRVNGAGYSPALKVDGINGPKTQAGIAWFQSRWTAETPKPEFDERTERLLLTIHPKAQEVARKFIRKLRHLGIDARIISGSRTLKEQAAIYAQGRTMPGNIVSWAPPGSSWHNWKCAFDLGLFLNGDYLEESRMYDECGPIGEALGLEWGGRWKRKDSPHYQLRPPIVDGLDDAKSFAVLRGMAAKGKDWFA